MRAGGQTKRELERHSGLPAEVSSLVGRGPQIAAILEGLRTARVVTLTGPGRVRQDPACAEGSDARGRPVR